MNFSGPSELWWARDIPIEHTTINGMKLRYIKTGRGPNLVLLHTVRTQFDIFYKVLPELRQKFTVHALDYPGHGYSDIVDVEYTPQLMADTVEAFLADREIENAKIVGVSIGASISLMLAARNNARIDRVIAINPFDYLGGGVGRGNAIAALIFSMVNVPVVGAVGMAMNNPMLERKILEGGVADPAALSKEFLAEVYTVGKRKGFSKAFRNLMSHVDEWSDIKPSYSAIKVPVRLVYGDRDWAKPAERKKTANLIPGVDLKTVPNGGHFLVLDQPKVTTQLIEEF